MQIIKFKSFSLASALALTSVFSLSFSVFAAGNGYAPTGGPGITNVPGGYTTVVTSKTFTAGQAGSLSATVNNAAVVLTVPSTAFSASTMVTLTAPSLASLSSSLAGTSFANDTAVAGVGIGLTSTSGQPVNASSPVIVTVKNSAIAPNDMVVRYGTGGWTRVSNATVTAGQATFSFQSDPDFAVLAPKTVPAATSPVTGVPIAEWGVLGLGLVGAGILISRRRV